MNKEQSTAPESPVEEKLKDALNHSLEAKRHAERRVFWYLNVYVAVVTTTSILIGKPELFSNSTALLLFLLLVFSWLGLITAIKVLSVAYFYSKQAAALSSVLGITIVEGGQQRPLLDPLYRERSDHHDPSRALRVSIWLGFVYMLAISAILVLLARNIIREIFPLIENIYISALIFILCLSTLVFVSYSYVKSQLNDADRHEGRIIGYFSYR